MSRPVMIFTHGAWHSPEYFDRVISILEPLGYKCVTVSMPSVGRVPPVTSLQEDIEAVRNAVLKELDGGHDVIVNVHSWSGIPVSGALDGLSRAERGDGRSSVRKLTFVASFVLPEGVSLEEFVGGYQDWWNCNREGNCLPGRDMIPFLYHDLEEADAKHWNSKLRPHSLATFQAKSKSSAWKSIPSTYLVCEDDQTVPVQAQDAMIAGMVEAGAEVVVERVKSSHSPHLSQPEFIAAFLRRAAGDS